MPSAAMIALLGQVLNIVIQLVPEVVTECQLLFTLFTQGTPPTPAQQASIDAALASIMATQHTLAVKWAQATLAAAQAAQAQAAAAASVQVAAAAPTGPTVAGAAAA